MRKKNSGDWLEGELICIKGRKQSVKACQLVGDTIFLFQSKSSAVTGYLELRNMTVLTTPSTLDDTIHFQQPMKSIFGEGMVNFCIRPYDMKEGLRWLEALHSVVVPIHSGFLELGKRTIGVTFWKRKWFRLHCLSLLYFDDSETHNRSVHGSLSLVPDCSIKMVDDTTLEIYSRGGGGHSQKRWLLRADSADQINFWHEAIKAAIARKNGETPVYAEVELVKQKAKSSSSAASAATTATNKTGGRKGKSKFAASSDVGGDDDDDGSSIFANSGPAYLDVEDGSGEISHPKIGTIVGSHQAALFTDFPANANSVFMPPPKSAATASASASSSNSNTPTAAINNSRSSTPQHPRTQRPMMLLQSAATADFSMFDVPDRK